MSDRTLATVGASAIVAYLVYALVVWPVETVGRHLLAHGVLRVALFGILVAFVGAVVVERSRLVKVGLAISAAGAALTLVGGIASVAMDGWTFDPFGAEGQARSLGDLWYPWVIGLGVLLFVVGPVVTAVGARAAGKLAALVGLGGLLYAAIPPSDAADFAWGGVAVWLAPWLVLAIALLRRGDGASSDAQPAPG